MHLGRFVGCPTRDTRRGRREPRCVTFRNVMQERQDAMSGSVRDESVGMF
jgi:hypothetical protein